MKLTDTYKFPEQYPNAEFVNPTLDVLPIVERVDPINMTIHVQIRFEVDGVNGNFAPNINPVPVNNLDYNGTELVDRILERLEDFKI
jgi:hypothetical protein